MSVHTLPDRAAADPAALRLPVGISELARRLDVARFGDDRLVNYIGQLVRDHGFPRPLPAPCKRRVVAGVHPNSKWLRAAVDHWFDGFLPPDCAAALDEKALEAAAASMDQAAANLRVVR